MRLGFIIIVLFWLGNQSAKGQNPVLGELFYKTWPPENFNISPENNCISVHCYEDFLTGVDFYLRVTSINGCNNCLFARGGGDTISLSVNDTLPFHNLTGYGFFATQNLTFTLELFALGVPTVPNEAYYCSHEFFTHIPWYDCNGYYSYIHGYPKVKACTLASPTPKPCDISLTNIISPTCENTCNGELLLLPITNTYTVNGNSAGNSLSGLCPDIYTIIGDDGNGCVDTLFYVLNPANVLVVQEFSTRTCNADSGQIKLFPNGGTAPYTYFPSGGTSIAGGIQYDLPCQFFSYTITDANGCSISGQMLPPCSNTISLTEDSTISSFCGSATGQIFTHATGGMGPYSYSIGTSPSNIFAQNSTGDFGNLTSGVYYTEVSDILGCTGGIYSGVSDSQISIGVDTIHPDLCGMCNGFVQLSEDNNVAGIQYSIGSITNTTGLFTGLCAGTYNVNYTNFGFCQGQIQIIIPQQLLTTAPTITTLNETCFGQQNGEAQVFISDTSFSYALNGIHFFNSDTLFQQLSPGNYFIRTAFYNCSQDYPFSIAPGNQINMQSTSFTPIDCFDNCNGSMEFTIQGFSGNYQVSGDFTFAGLNDSILELNGLCAGNYFIQITDSLNCITQTNFSLTQPDSLELSLSIFQPATCSSCTDGQAFAQAQGGTAPFTYSWNNSAAATALVTDLFPGWHWVCVTDSAGCSRCDSVEMTFALPQIQNPFSPSAIILSIQENHIQFEVCEDFVQWEMMDLNGKVILHGNFEQGAQADIVFPKLAAGIYIFRANGKNCSPVAYKIFFP